MLAYSKDVLNFINESKSDWRKLMSSVNKNRFHKRGAYELLYNQLRMAGKETIEENIEMVTNHTLLTEINTRLIEQNCIPYTQQEIYDILDKIN